MANFFINTLWNGYVEVQLRVRPNRKTQKPPPKILSLNVDDVINKFNNIENYLGAENFINTLRELQGRRSITLLKYHKLRSKSVKHDTQAKVLVFCFGLFERSTGIYRKKSFTVQYS